MLTKLTVKNFKRSDEVEVELGSPVVFIGPNDSGKTTALQALALWEVGLRRWLEKRGGRPAPEKRPGVTINRRDLVSVPVPDSIFLWHDLHVRDVRRDGTRQQTSNLRIDILVEGASLGEPWACGLEFDYANEESFYCRPLRDDSHPSGRMPVPEPARDVRIAFLPPMSGLASSELEQRLEQKPGLTQRMWQRREIESYLCQERALLGWAVEEAGRGSLFEETYRGSMEKSIEAVAAAMEILGKGSPWSPDAKVSDDFLRPLFERFYAELGLPNLMRKTDFHRLAPHVPRELIDPEIIERLDEIVAIAQRAKPAGA